MKEAANLSRSKRARLRDLREDCENSGLSDQTEIIREALPIFADATKTLGLPACSLKTEADLETLIDDNAFETAALQMLSKGSSFIVSQGQEGVCFASVLLPGDGEEKSSVGDTVALSLMGAEASALLAVSDSI